MLISKKDITAPTLPEQVVPVPVLNGEVIVRSLSLSERISLSRDPTLKGANGSAIEQANQFAHLMPMLAFCVLDADRQPLFTAEQWEAWGANHNKEAIELWDIAWRLSDMDGSEAKKNLETPPTSDSQ